MPQPPRLVTLDWARARPDRVPILPEGRVALEFGERVTGQRDGESVRGMVGWDPTLGWVMIFDVPGFGERPPGGRG